MKICVIGGGNIGTLMAAELSAKGNDVWVLTSSPEQWPGTLDVLDENNAAVIQNVPVTATTNLAEAVQDAAYVFVTYPTYLLADLCERLLPHIGPGQRIGMVPGACGELFLHPLMETGCTLFGLQRAHSIARLKERGRSVYMLGRKPSISVAVIPASEAAPIASDLSDWLNMPAGTLPSYLDLTLTPSNPILHTSRIRTMFAGWHEGVTYPKNFLFYEEWDMAASELMLAMDDELQGLCATVPMDLSGVKSLRAHYESPDAVAMTRKISGIQAFKGLLSPMREVAENRWVPDFASRYFRADFAYGLRAIQGIAHLCGAACPHMDEVVAWYENVSGNRNGLRLPWASMDEMVQAYTQEQ